MIQKIVGAALITLGLFVVIIAVTGTFRFKYVLNRMHAAALCDTLGMLLMLSGVIVSLGFTLLSAKVAIIIVFQWMASPVLSHLISRAEVMTHPHLSDVCEVHEDENSL